MHLKLFQCHVQDQIKSDLDKLSPNSGITLDKIWSNLRVYRENKAQSYGYYSVKNLTENSYERNCFRCYQNNTSISFSDTCEEAHKNIDNNQTE